MKTILTGSYPFSPIAKTVDFSSVSGFDERLLYCIINLAARKVIYAAGTTGLGASFSGSVATLDFNTAAMNSADPLMVFYEETGALSVSVSNLPSDYPDSAAHTALASILSALQSPLPLPAGAATETSLASVVAQLMSVNTTLSNRNDIATALYTDDSGAYYVRRDIINASGSVAVTFTDATGNPAVPGTGLRPLAGTNKISTTVSYDATAGGTGYSTGDILARVLITDVSVTPPTAVAIWENMTQGTTLSVAPTAGTYIAVAKDINVTASALPSGASTSANQTAANTSLSSIDGGIGGASAAAAGDTGASTTNGFLRWLRDYFYGITVKALGVQVVSTDNGIVTNSVIHGLTTGGGGGYVDVKVNPSGALTVDASGSTVTVTQSSAATSANRSGTITAGGSSQTLMAANAPRRGWNFQNNSAGDLWVNDTGAAATIGSPSLRVVPGAYYESPSGYCSNSAITVIGATTGQAFTAREF